MLSMTIVRFRVVALVAATFENIPDFFPYRSCSHTLTYTKAVDKSDDSPTVIFSTMPFADLIFI